MSAPASAAGATAPGIAGRAGPAPSVQARTAALLLHGLPAPDREWLLAQLPDAERATLAALVSELESLGIPADRALVDGVVGSIREAGATSAPDAAGPGAKDRAHAGAGGGDAPIESLDRADPALLAEVLRDEPSGLVARLWMLREWRWRDALLRELGADQERRVRELVTRSSGPDHGRPPGGPGAGAGASLAKRLVEMVLERLDHPTERRGDDARGQGRRDLSPERPRSFLAQLLRKGARP